MVQEFRPVLFLDKENTEHRKGIFMMDASKGFLKDGNKNRLREQDLRKITDVFTQMQEVPKYSRMVPISEIADAKNDYNLNIPRYIDTQENEDIQDLLAHLQGGIPVRDLEAMQTYWNAYPKLKHDLFSPLREGYVKLNVAVADIKTTIFNHPEFRAFNDTLNKTYNHWLSDQYEIWEKLAEHSNGKDLIAQMSESLLKAFENNTLVNGYDLYQHAMTYWQETMQDDVYSISLDGWKAGNEWERTIIKGKKGKDGKAGKDKEVSGLAGIEGRMISPDLLINFYFSDLMQEIYALKNEVENAQTLIAEIEEEQSGEEGLFADLEKINAAEVLQLLKAKQKGEVKMVAEPNSKYGTQTIKSDLKILEDYLSATSTIKENNRNVKLLEEKLEEEVIAKYPKLSENDIKQLVIDGKWMTHLKNTLHQEQDKISQGLTQRINALAERYAKTLATSQMGLATAETKVMAHLEKMGLVW